MSADDPNLISLNEFAKMLSLSRTGTNRRRAQDPKFPKPVPLGERRIAFVRAEAVRYVRDLIAAARASNSEAA